MPHLTNATLLVAITIVVAAVIVVLAWMTQQRRRREHLRERFGPEYDRTLHAVGTTGRADALLAEREKRVAEYRIRALDPEEQRRFSAEWTRVQAKFVDEPAAAVTEADRLVAEVMNARGYPMADFDRRAEDLTVEHGGVVEHYRAAREIATRHARNAASTEELRQALMHYRELF